MRKNLFLVLYISLMLALLIIPTNSWVCQDGMQSDQKIERFGPRADKLLIKLYPNETAEWDALARGEIDMADWPLSTAYYDLFTSNAINPATELPYNQTISTFSYGAEYGIYILDINNNNNEFLGNPPNPAYPNPIYPNPCSVREFRQAIAHLVDRSQLDVIIGKGFYASIYTPVPPSMGNYAHPEIRPGGALENLTYPYLRAAAEVLLDLHGFPVNASTGWRYWDRNHNNIEELSEYLDLKFYIRYDDPERLAFGNLVADELNAVKVRVSRIYNIVIQVLDQVYIYKNFHLYTGGWSLGVDPDHLILWNWDYYWHPGRPPNYAGINNPDFNTYSNNVLLSATSEQAKVNAWLAQEVFASEALSVPLWSNAASKAMSRIYTGGNKWTPITPDDGENAYRAQYWEGTVNMPASGIDNFCSFLNMHPKEYDRGDGENMTIRWGFRTTKLKSFNPIFAEWDWDWKVLKQIYESLIIRNPNNLAEFMPWLAENFEVGTYNHPVYGECTKVKFAMRTEATWHDGIPITTADVYFTWVELWRIMEKRLPWPIWNTWHGRESWNKPMVDLKILDPYNFEMLFDFKSCLIALNWISNEVILPKHVWKPIVETAPLDVLTGPAPDPNMIGSGPWRFKEYVANSRVLLVANIPGGSVQTSHASSTLVMSPMGYWRYLPLNLVWRIDGSTLSKTRYGESHTVSFTIGNLYYDCSITVDVYSKVTYPNGTVVESVETNIMLSPAEQSGSNWTWSHTGVMKRKIRVDINVFVKSPTAMIGWLNATKYLWTTLPLEPWGGYHPSADITGSYYVDPQLPVSDFKVDIKDIAEASKAFGTCPGHSRWSLVGDINNDYKIDMKDIASIAKRFGWIG